MIIDTSALLAILLAEEDAAVFARAIALAARPAMSAASYLEAAIKADLHAQGSFLDALIEQLDIAIEPVTAEQARIARSAYRMFGKSNHPARLNYGDCFSYALAKATSEPLLFKGGDFARTDILSAL